MESQTPLKSSPLKSQKRMGGRKRGKEGIKAKSSRMQRATRKERIPIKITKRKGKKETANLCHGNAHTNGTEQSKKATLLTQMERKVRPKERASTVWVGRTIPETKRNKGGGWKKKEGKSDRTGVDIVKEKDGRKSNFLTKGGEAEGQARGRPGMGRGKHRIQKSRELTDLGPMVTLKKGLGGTREGGSRGSTLPYNQKRRIIQKKKGKKNPMGRGGERPVKRHGSKTIIGLYGSHESGTEPKGTKGGAEKRSGKRRGGGKGGCKKTKQKKRRWEENS